MKGQKSPFSLGVVATAAIPAVAFAIHDFILQAPDNHHEPTTAFLLGAGGLLGVWGFSGYLASRRATSFVRAVGNGALVGLLSVAILWLVAVVLNNLFLQRMSYEPDRMLAFHNSNYSSLRAYVTFGLLFSPFFVVLAGAAFVVATVAAGVGNVLAGKPTGA
jgi:hypothetical protein